MSRKATSYLIFRADCRPRNGARDQHLPELLPHPLPGPNVDGIILPTAIRRERLTEHETTGKIGYFCSYVPKEIIYALGKTPVRVLPAASKASAAEAFLPRNFCSLVKVTLASFLEGGSDLEGVVHSDSCDGLRRLHDVWRHYVDVEALHLLDLPRNDTPVSQDYFAHALGKLVKKLENRYEVELTAERLSSSIHRYNEQRALVAELEHGWGAGQIGTETYLGLRRASPARQRPATRRTGQLPE
jgi:hypothetical protein